ncbi:MAG: CHAP domain-containing protein, partial [Caulobacter sp.]
MTKRTRTLLGSLAAAAMISLVPVSGANADGYWQCVPFARLMSGIQIFGDARTWWSQAAGKY